MTGYGCHRSEVSRLSPVNLVIYEAFLKPRHMIHNIFPDINSVRESTNVTVRCDLLRKFTLQFKQLRITQDVSTLTGGISGRAGSVSGE